MSNRHLLRFVFAVLSIASIGASVFVACSNDGPSTSDDASTADASSDLDDSGAIPPFDGSTNLPDGSTLLPDGAVALPDGGVLTAREACVEMQIAKCSRALQCEKGNPFAWPESSDPFFSAYSSPESRLEDCVKRYVSRCEFYRLPGSILSLQQFLQCEAARVNQPCEELHSAATRYGYDVDENGNTYDRYNTPAACRFFGDRAPGQKCMANSQCSSGSCSQPMPADGGTCGARCVAPVPRGGACMEGVGGSPTPACAPGLECVDNPDGGFFRVCDSPRVPKPGLDEGRPCTIGDGGRETTCKREVPCTSTGPGLPAGICKKCRRPGKTARFVRGRLWQISANSARRASTESARWALRGRTARAT